MDPTPDKKMARLKWRMAADPHASEGPYVEGHRQAASATLQPSGANNRLVGYSPWKTLEQVEEDIAKLDALPAASRWYTYEIQMKEDENEPPSSSSSSS